MGQTVAEKIISRHAGQAVYQDQLAIAQVDAVMATDATAPFAIKAFHEMGGKKLWQKEKVVLIIDHASPAPNERVGNLHKMMRDFAAQTGCLLYDVGAGIGHQLMVENGHVRPGELVLGADSHTCGYGAVNSFATGVGSTDLAAVMLTGKTWLKVPRTIKVELTGSPPAGTVAKDLILFLVGKLGIDGATYQAIEFTGDAVERLSVAGRMVLASMAVEMGAKAGIVSAAGLQLPYAFNPVFADPDACYSAVHRFDVSSLGPQISLPHSPDNLASVAEVQGTRIDMAFIGTCTNGRLEDLQAAAAILKGKQVASHVRMVIAPASRQVFQDALKDGTVQTLPDAGATFITSGCGPCVGTHLGVPGDGEVVISAANRNFQGRMGNPNARIYLASPETVAASALRGMITSPAEASEKEAVPR